MWFEIMLVLAVFILALIHFGETTSQLQTTNVTANGSLINNRKPRIYSVFYKAGVFSPTNLRIRVGDTVKFQNDGLTSLRVISDIGDNGEEVLSGLDSINDVKVGESYIYRFSKSGIFSYHNFYNELERGTVIVRDL